MTRKKRQQYSLECVQAGNNIGQRTAQFGRRPIRKTREIHHARLTLGNDVVTWPVPVWSSVTEPGDRAIYRSGIRLGNGLVSKPQPGQDARPEVLDHDVGSLDQLPENAASLFGLQVQTETLLVPIDR